jgi:hypothetical protein
MYSRSLSLSSQKKLSVSLSLFRFRNARAPSPKKESKQHNFAGGEVFLFFFSEEDSLFWAKEDRPRFESEEKERSEMYKVDERVFFLFVERERARAHHPVPKEKNF